MLCVCMHGMCVIWSYLQVSSELGGDTLDVCLKAEQVPAGLMEVSRVASYSSL